GERGMVYFFASQPVAADRCTGYVVIGRNYNLDQPGQVIQEFEDTIFGQDQVVVESQRPERDGPDLAAPSSLPPGRRNARRPAVIPGARHEADLSRRAEHLLREPLR